MCKLLTFALMLCVVGVAAAADLDSQPPVKSPSSGPENIPNPLLQGGDTIATAFAIPPLAPGAVYCDDGTTAGYTDNYNEVCPYTSLGAPDVVYSYTPTATGNVKFDLCGSSYDTKLYIYAGGYTPGSPYACNDDFYFGAPCGQYVSFIDCLALTAGTTYYIVVDGYSSVDFGAYHLCLSSCVTQPPCVLQCPTDGVPEGEPTLIPSYADHYNGGCNSTPFIFQHISGWCPPQPQTIFCGVAGWYSPGSRDTDWFNLCIGPTGCITITADAERATQTYQLTLGTPDCSSIAAVQSLAVGPCAPGTMQICGTPGSSVYFFVAAIGFTPPPGSPPEFEYDYTLWITGLCCEVVGTEGTTWSTLKALYN